MSIRVRRYQPEDRAGIARLNDRLAAGGAAYTVYPESGDAKDPARPITERLFVAADDGEIRGAVWLKEHAVSVAGVPDPLRIGWLKYPVAESLVDARFNGVPGSLLLQCLREQPRLLALGLGGHATPLARMLARLKWSGTTVPLFFKPVRPSRVLRELGPLRRSGPRRALAESLRWTGLGWAGWQGWRGVNALVRPRPDAAGLRVQEEPTFGPWADETWKRCGGAYGFLTVRDAAMLRSMYGPHGDITRLRVMRGGTELGWACVVRHDFAVGPADPNFGRLTVGSIADALALPRDATAVMAAAASWLQDSGAEVLISNQLHPAWTGALRAAGFLAGPSSFALYAAPAAQQVLATEAVRSAGVHVDRGDCDGPIWYAPA